MNRYCIGLATTLHDPALAIVNPAGELVFAEATERYLQNKRAINCEPDHIFRIAELIRTYCEPSAEFAVALTWSSKFVEMPIGISLASLFRLIKPELITRLRINKISSRLLLKPYQLYHLMLCARSSHLKAGANLVTVLRSEFDNTKVSFLYFDHHLTHAATACYTSPFAEGVCMIVDGFGERGTIAYYTYRDGEISLIKQHKGQESLGALYMLITDLCGFSTFKGEEWKVMGLAPYGRFSSAIYDQLRSIVKVHGCDIRYASRRKIRHAMQNLESFRRREDSSPLDAADLAYNGQLVFSEIMNALLKHFHDLTRANNLILGGGCALNSSYVGSILENTGFKNLHVPCAPTDDGNALGAALLAYEKLNIRRSARLPIPSPYLGSSICPGTLRRLAETGDPKRTRHLPGQVHREAARILAEGKIVGWIQGRAEFGPRALGDRSILADPRPSDMKERINKMVKFRENFRPFAPSILHEYGNEYFENYQESPYMERVLRFRKEVVHKVPAVVHVDRTGRLQTVKRSWNKRFYELIEEFYQLTQIPILLNTSFNVMGKPMIHSVEDALGVFYTTGLDALVIEDYLLEK